MKIIVTEYVGYFGPTCLAALNAEFPSLLVVMESLRHSSGDVQVRGL